MVDFTKGQTVTFAQATRGERAGGWGHPNGFRRGDTAEVTAVRKNMITVRYQGYSYNVARQTLDTPIGEAWAEVEKPKVRKLGTVPEGGIEPDDPRIAWIFEDAAKLAKNYGYCGIYDEITDRLSIPGRVRDIRVSLTVDGLSITATVQARSTKEAELKVREKLQKA